MPGQSAVWPLQGYLNPIHRFVHHTFYSLRIMFKSKPLQVKRAVQQTGFKRTKRGYTRLVVRTEDLPISSEPTDPYFEHQWYLVCI